MASRCSGLTLNCRNHRQTRHCHFTSCFSNRVLGPLFPIHLFKNVLFWDVSSLDVLCSNFLLNITTTHPFIIKKRKKSRKKIISTCIHRQHCHSQTKKMLSIHLYYILIPEQLTTKHVYLVVILIFTLIFQLEPHHLFFFFLLPRTTQFGLLLCFVSYCISSSFFFVL